MTIKDILSTPMNAQQLLEKVRERLRPVSDEEQQKLHFLAQNLPEWSRQVVQKADCAMAGRFILPGTNNELYFVGDPPNWFDNPVGDEEFVWALNRHHHFKTLTQAYHITGDRRYAERTIYELLYWIESCPMPDISTDYATARERFYAVDPWRTLEVAIRISYNWYALLIGLVNTEFFTAEVLERFVISVYEHGRALREVTPIFWPNADHNHYLHEMFGLLTISVILPELKSSRQWQNFAISELERCFKAQFTDDGGQREGSPGYHDCCLRMVYECLELAKSADIELPPIFTEVVHKAATYSAFTVKPDATRAALGDSDGEITAIPKLLALQFGIFNSMGAYQNIIGLLSDKLIQNSLLEYSLLFGDPTAFRSALSNNAVDPDVGRSNYQKQLSQTYYRSSWGKDALYFMFSCLTPVPNGHAHIDPMTFELSICGQSIVVDPGRYGYAENELRRTLKSPQYHSTLTIGDKPPFEYIDTWSYTPQKQGYINRVYDGDVFGAEAVHYNYEPAVHRRLVCAPNERVFIVLDDVYNPARDSVRMYFHINGTDVTDDAGRISIADKEVKLYYQQGLTVNILDGHLSPISDVLVPSKRVEMVDSSVKAVNTKYLTVFSADGDVHDISVIDRAGVTEFSFNIDSTEYAFSYKFGERLDRIK